MKSKNIPVNAKSKSIKEIKEEINHILEKLENNRLIYQNQLMTIKS
jgi:hypothetical protein